jgi:hypothetical protein
LRQQFYGLWPDLQAWASERLIEDLSEAGAPEGAPHPTPKGIAALRLAAPVTVFRTGGSVK